MVSNAGYGPFGAAEELSDEQVSHITATNLTGSIQLIRASLPHLRAQGGGRIIQISTYGGQAAFPGNSMYHATVRRLSFLPDDTLQVLRASSILGSSFTVTDLATVTGRSALEPAETLARAVATHVIEDDGAHLRLRHDLIRDAIYDIGRAPRPPGRSPRRRRDGSRPTSAGWPPAGC